MSITIEVLADAGRPVVVKRAEGADVPRLRAEGDRLRVASHPGVVQIVSSAPMAGGWELRTVHAGRPLDVVGPVTVDQVAAIAAGLATTLADLHASGIVHGRVDPSHVLMGPHGRPVLCSFHAYALEERRGPEVDVAGVGAIIVSLLGTEGEAEPIPDRRWRRRQHWSGWERRALLTLADHACSEPATRRPSARRLAAAISAAMPAAALASPDVAEAGLDPSAHGEPTDPLDALRATAATPPDRSAPRWVSVAVAGAGVAALVVALHRSGADPRNPSADAPSVEETAWTDPDPDPEGDRAPLVPPTTTTDSIVAASCGPVDGVDLAGDGCRDTVTVDGQMVSVGDTRFQVGMTGDHVSVRDWDCDGEPTAAVLRPSTGEVFLFTGWNPDSDVVVRPIATVVGGMELVLGPASEVCSGLSVRTSTSVVEIVRAPA